MTRRILQVGYGAFGQTHLCAWQALGLTRGLIVADPRPEARQAARATGGAIETVADYRDALARCDAVDIVAPSDAHHAIAAAALDAGKPVLIEKPMVATAAQARDLAARAARAGRIVRGGYYFRYHPKTVALRRLMAEGALGELRVLTGRFAGLKRTRADSGALLNDAVHFLDLFTWLIGKRPSSLYAVTRDHFGRGLEDFALIVLQFASGAVAHIETGYIQPGRWPDAVVPGAVTSKEIALSGGAGIVEIDYAGETMSYRAARHVARDGTWLPQLSPSQPVDAPAATPLEVVTAELRDFLKAIDSGGESGDDGLDGGGVMAQILEAASHSAATGQAVALDAGA
jgi:predicted dehydrogenase